MTWVTRLYNKIKGLKWPWLYRMLGIVEKNIIIPAARAVGEAGKDYIVARIIEESKKNISGPDKLRNVFALSRKEFSVDKISNDFLTNLIQNIVSSMKVEKQI